jgi:hypothetical protein
VDPAIKKRVDLYRSLVLLGPRDECASPDGSMLSFYGDHVVEEGVGAPAALVRAMLGRDYYGADVLKMACDCFQLRDGFRLDPANPLHQRILLLILAHVVFGVGRKRGRAKDSKNWTDIKYYHLAALYIEIKSKQPKLSDSKIAEVIAGGGSRKRLSANDYPQRAGCGSNTSKRVRKKSPALSKCTGSFWRRASRSGPKRRPI